MNKKVDLLIDEPCPELLCGICSDVLEDPIQVHCPEDHMFCSKCITGHVQQNSNCPMCLTELDKTSFQLSKFVQRQISRLRIKCLYADNGCPWKGVLSDDHITNCEYKPSTCPNADKGCNVQNLTNLNMQEHLKSCLYQIINCPNNMPLCQPFLLKDLSKHENECQSYTCPYAAEGCPFIGTLSQAKSHCDRYCGRLHNQVNNLEEEVKRLKKLIQEYTFGLDIKLPSTPDTTMQEDGKKEQDTNMEDLDLFRLFNEGQFAAMDLTPTSNTTALNLTSTASATAMILAPTPNAAAMSLTPTPNATTSEKSADSMMDLSACLPFFNNDKETKSEQSESDQAPTDMKETIDIDSLFESATSPQPLQFVMPLNAPKRTSNGKKIRYSKNKLLAHNALRIQRQRTASNHNPSNDAILNNLDIAKQKKTQVVFKNMDDVTKFLNTDASTTKTAKSSPTPSSLATPKSTNNTAKKEKKKSISSPQPNDTALSPVSSNSTTTTTPRRRPMFILASQYLSNYNSETDKV